MNYEAKTDRELDALVAEKVMGDKLCRDPECEGCDNWTPENVGSFSENMQLAHLVIENMVGRGYADIRINTSFINPDGWFVNFAKHRDLGGDENQDATSLPRAICIAALRACE